MFAYGIIVACCGFIFWDGRNKKLKKIGALMALSGTAMTLYAVLRHFLV